MNLLSIFPFPPYPGDDLLKTAARWSTKKIRELVAEGRYAEATQLAQELAQKDALKLSGPGTNVGRLGSGVEGVADVTIGAKDAPGLAVRKTFDPAFSAVSKSSVQDKFNTLRRIRGIPEGKIFAQLLSKRLGHGAGGSPYWHTEFAPPGIGVSDKVATGAKRVAGALERPGRGSLRRRLVDVRPGNMTQAKRGAVPKIVDFLSMSPRAVNEVKRALIGDRLLNVPEYLEGKYGKLLGSREDMRFSGRIFRGPGEVLSSSALSPLDPTGKTFNPANPTRALRGLGPGGFHGIRKYIPPVKGSSTLLGEAATSIRPPELPRSLAPTIVDPVLSGARKAGVKELLQAVPGKLKNLLLRRL